MFLPSSTLTTTNIEAFTPLAWGPKSSSFPPRLSLPTSPVFHPFTSEFVPSPIFS